MTRYLLASLLMLAALTAWLTLGKDAPLEPLASKLQAQSGLRQSYLEGATLWRYDETGQREQTIELGNAEQLIDSDTQFLTELRYQGPDADGQLWIMTASKGELRNNGDELFLVGDVSIADNHNDSVTDASL